MPEQIQSPVTDCFSVENLNCVIRSPELSNYDKKMIFDILNCGLVAHVSFLNQGRPMVVPMIYGRDAKRLVPDTVAMATIVAACSGTTFLLPLIEINDSVPLVSHYGRAEGGIHAC